MVDAQEYAGFWRQLWAGSLDIVIAMLSSTILFIIAIAIFSGMSSQSDFPLDILSRWFNTLALLYYFLYRTLSIASKSKATYGMRAMDIMVTDYEGNRISFLRTCTREALTYISAFFFWLGYLIIPFTARKQGFHDILTGCLVLKKTPVVKLI